MYRTALGVGVGWLGISMVADGVPALLLPHQLLASGSRDATTLGLMTLVAISVAAAVQPGAGWLSDRVGRAPLLIAGSLMATAGLTMLLSPGLEGLGAVAALAGVSVAQAGYQALLPERVRAVWRGRAAGVKTAFDLFGAFLAFAVLAALLGAGRAPIAVILTTGILVGGFIAAGMLLRRPDAEIADEVTPQRAPEPAQRWAFASLVLGRFLFLLGIYVVGRFLLLFVAERLGMDTDAATEAAGGALALLSFTTILAAIPSGWLADRAGRRPLILAGAALSAAGIALLPAADSLGVILAFGGLMALGTAAFSVASWAMLADVVASRDAGTMLGIANLGTAGAAAAAGAFGLLIDFGGFGPAFSLAAACSLAGGLVVWSLSAGRTSMPGLAPVRSRAG